MKGLIAAVVIMLVIGIGSTVFSVGSYVHYANLGTDYTQWINKYDQNSQNVRSSTALKIKEIAKVPEMYVSDLQKIIKDTFQGRYGENGSQATFQWIKEQNLPLDSSMYTKIQNVIDAGRNEFKLSQTQKIDVCTEYQRQLGYVWSGFWLKLTGHTYDGVADKCKVVLDDSTIEVFKTGVDKPML